MERELDCVGKVILGSLSAEAEAQLNAFEGEWLEYSSKESAIVVRHVEPGGTPALSGVPSELFSMLGVLSMQERDDLPGGDLVLKDRHGKALRIFVSKGEVRVQWPHLHYEDPVSLSVDEAFAFVNSAEAKVEGWARFPGDRKSVEKLQTMLDRFEGLYEEGEFTHEMSGDEIYVKFLGVNVGPKELLSEIENLAGSKKHLNAELHISSFNPDETTRDFRLTVKGGELSAVRPTLWK